jgi:hypothetical protein
VETNATLARPAGIVVLHPEAAENLNDPVVHAHWDSKLELAQRIPQEISGSRVKAQIFGYLVELSLCDLK